jgi:hypothetical protein
LKLGRIGINQFEFQMGHTPDDVERSHAVRDAGQLDNELILTLALDNGLADTHGIDAVTQDLDRPQDSIAFGVGVQLLGLHFQNEMHSALKIQT